MEALREPILVFQRCSIAYGNKMPEKTKHYLLPFFSFTYPPNPSTPQTKRPLSLLQILLYSILEISAQEITSGL